MKTNMIDKIKQYSGIIALSIFALIALAVILVATLGMQEFVVPVCVLVIIEVLMAALLRNSEIWKHGVVVIVQLAAGFFMDRFPLTALCVVIYVAATVALMFLHKSENAESEEQVETEKE